VGDIVDDYAFSRHFADPTRPLVFGWTVECGSSFQPPYSEAVEVIKETSSGLLRFALSLHELTDTDPVASDSVPAASPTL
jgi:hypothetical protein